MREILPNQLWLGNAMDGRDSRALYNANIAAIVDLALEQLPCKPNREIVYCRFPLIDGFGNEPALISAAISATASLIRLGVPTLVCCSAGRSRSPAIVAAALALVHGDEIDSCLRRLVAEAPHDISPALWADVTSACRDLG